MTIEFTPNAKVSYAWDAERHGWDRFQVDSQHGLESSAFLDADGAQVAPENVVVLYTPYGTSAADKNSPQAFTVGEGDALVFTDGQWSPALGPADCQRAGTAAGRLRSADLAHAGPYLGGAASCRRQRGGLDQATADGFLAVRG